MLSFQKSGIGAAALLVAGCCFSAAVAHAQVNGSLWENDLSDNAGVVPGGAPNVTFTTPGINFHSGIAYTIGEFLTSASSSVLTGAGELGNSLDNVHIQLTGSLFLSAGDNLFSVQHDDGLVLQISGLGTVLDAHIPTPPIVTPFTVHNTLGAGIYSYTLDYNECCGAPAALAWVYPTGQPVGSVPDAASTLTLLGLATTCLVAWRKRFGLRVS